MKATRSVLLSALALTLLLAHATACSFETEDPSFVDRSDPDAPYSAFAAGRIGVVLNTYRIRHLIVAYRYLTGTPLTHDEQQAAVAVDQHYNNPGEGAAWDSGRKVPGQDYQFFSNCLQDASVNAARTLAQRQKTYGANNPEVLNWQQAQDAVFSNCKAPGIIPDPAPANASLWLKQDRAYQIAAAHFYALDYDAAIADFRAIAADHASPWHTLAPYLVARCYIRRALVLYNPADNANANAAYNRVYNDLTAAKDQLDKVLADPALAALHPAAGHLRDYVQIRRDPAAQATVLANRLAHPASAADYQQNAIDLTYIWNASEQPHFASGHKSDSAASLPAPLEAWLDAFKSKSNPDDTLTPPNPASPAPNTASTQYQSTHQPLWLIAALTSLKSGTSETPALIAAARTLPATSPAYPSVTYQRLRLTAATQPAATFKEISDLLPALEKSQPRSSINLFANLRPQTAPDLASFLRTAPLQPASMGDFARTPNPSTAAAPATPSTPASTATPNPEAEPTTPSSTITLCGIDTQSPDSLHFSSESATVLNQRMPLALMRQAVLANILPKNLNFTVAHAAWTRALILDDPATANALAPILATCQPAFKPWLDRYAAAKTPDDRRAAALLALMRFTSTNPNVAPAIERDFAAYDEFRDNWWCNTTSPNYQTESYAPTILTPPFLTQADQATANQELVLINKQALNASDYFAAQTLNYVAAHPTDPRNPDLLGFSMRVVRNACRTEATKELNHQLFDTLHRKYPTSSWARKYTTWE